MRSSNHQLGATSEKNGSPEDILEDEGRDAPMPRRPLLQEGLQTQSAGVQLGYMVKRADERKVRKRTFIKDLDRGSSSLGRDGKRSPGKASRPRLHVMGRM